MPNGQATQQEQASPRLEKLHDVFWNRIKRLLGSFNIFRYGTLRGQTAPIKQLLPISLNENLIDLLTRIETAWTKMDTYLWDENPKILTLYEGFGHYDDPAVVELEAEKFRTGGEFSYDPNTGYSELRPIEVNWTDGNREELHIFGVSRISDVLERWKNVEESLDQRSIAAGMDAGNRRFATNLRSGVAAILREVQETEEKFLGDLLKKSGLHRSLTTLRNDFLQDTETYNRYIRFKHTYKVIKPFFWDEENKRAVYFDPNKNRLLYRNPIVNHQLLPNQGIYRYTSFKPWPWEQYTGWENEDIVTATGHRVRLSVWTGLDENGYPLEIDNDGVVLLDKWWYEIGENDWQRLTIGGGRNVPGLPDIEGKKGGDEILRRIDYIRANGIRVVDKRFATTQAYLDLLEMAVYIYNEVDSVRDDLRDGRYHKYSKTATDYIIHAESGLKIDVNKFTKVKEILKKPIELIFNQFDTANDYGYIKARPEYFNRNIPSEELEVKRTYKIKDYKDDLPIGPRLELSEERERKPTNLSPAFDRRALNSVHPHIHWGRMYYYEDTEGINRWSENPYPHISTRGIAKYIMYWIATRTQNLEEAKEAAESEKGYDIGIRRKLVGGKFIKNPFNEIMNQ